VQAGAAMSNAYGYTTTTTTTGRKDMMSTTLMTRHERNDIERLIRDRERVARGANAARAAELKANFEQQMAAEYSYDQDEVWKEAHRLAAEAVSQAKRDIADRCQKLGIPPQFAPGLNLHWYDRGENAVASRRTELRRVAYTGIDAQLKEANSQAALGSSQLRVRLLSGSLQSDEAKAFLASMPSAEDLMPQFTLKEIEQKAKLRGLLE
jgi:hypothetical protein